MTRRRKNLLKLPALILLIWPVLLLANLLMIVGTIGERIGSLAQEYLPRWER